jgi:hypothetical protein
MSSMLRDHLEGAATFIELQQLVNEQASILT